ncbi:LysR family transcriptional regulator [Bacteriovorax sp. PP10]|uniref:LysR family transcriptional regulator n=1 Tax=Bacteriovorax antarcticus TaxID=3088717 RepID=A0ABU5VU65_9BACT|nr:LysR family transcriptional regulator [Bacteriovorax sp. PP10]MEA9355904.1 LysR family transcriptional regulator [Bacteriovorax sp. PP10]
MLDGIEALMALEKHETVSQAALSLRLTQSAVSKRLQALQIELDMKLVEPDGRRLKLTPEALQFLSKAKPLLLELKNLSINTANKSNHISHFSLALSDSIAGSFGPAVIDKTLKSFKNLKLDIHVHRSLMLLENVTLGKYQLGICTSNDARKDLASYHLVDEPLALLYAENKDKPNRNLPLITIEENSATWKSIGPSIKKEYPQLFANSVIYVESFLAVYQMTKVGLGNGLIPLGLCKELNIKKKHYRKLKVTRPISLVTRKTIAQLDIFNPFYLELKTNINNYFADIEK